MQDSKTRNIRPSSARSVVEVMGFGLALVVVAWSAVIAKQATVGPAFVAIDTAMPRAASASTDVVFPTIAASPEVIPTPVEVLAAEKPAGEPAEVIRYFDGKKVRAARTILMTVTAYSPDHRSCGKWADGRTATNHSVWTNGMNLVAADIRLLPYGSLVSVPGYAEGDVVPVLDCGGAIKGARLDVLYATHSIARKWGVQRIPVTVWEYVENEG